MLSIVFLNVNLFKNNNTLKYNTHIIRVQLFYSVSHFRVNHKTIVLPQSNVWLEKLNIKIAIEIKIIAILHQFLLHEIFEKKSVNVLQINLGYFMF